MIDGSGERKFMQYTKKTTQKQQAPGSFWKVWIFLKKKKDTYVNVNPRYQVQKIMFSAE